jgi:hypothetical protein
MRKKILLGTTFSFFFLFTSCQKEEPIRCELPYSPEISKGVTTFFLGETIEIKALDYKYSDVKYKWSGPNGFNSELQNISIPKANLNMAGEYRLKAVKGICETKEVSVNIEVIDNSEVTCNTIKNRLDFSDRFSDFTFNDQDIKTESTDSFFTFKGYSYNRGIGIELNFKTDNKVKPNTGIYTIVNKTAELDSKTAHLKISWYNQNTVNTTYYNALSGKVLITYQEGKMYVKFCSIPFAQNGITDFSVSSELLENRN